MNFFEKSEKNMEELKMQNDFENRDFWVEKDQSNNKKYYIKMYGKWIEIPKEVYAVYKNSYQKMYRSMNTEKDILRYYKDIDLAHPYLISHHVKDILDTISNEDLKQLLYLAISELSEEEKYIIVSIYFDGMSERNLAEILDMKQPTLHYRKIKILKKLKKLLINSSNGVHS